jgi:S1-C subfamily serine protease
MRRNTVPLYLRLFRAALFGAIFLGLLSMLNIIPHADGAIAQPRPVTPRGELFADEKANIRLFENSRNSVVYITTRAQVQDFWSRDIMSVPRGTGSGFIWDEYGHIVTNYHVI